MKVIIERPSGFVEEYEVQSVNVTHDAEEDPVRVVRPTVERSRLTFHARGAVKVRTGWRRT